jgi:nucleoside-diphosphate-sugar epimerase
MRVFIAGAAGVLGLPLARRLVEAGHRVTGLTRSASKQALIESVGADAVIADALHRETVEAALRASRPSHVVNLLTALPPSGARSPRDLRSTNRLRVEGSRNLLAAALEAGARRVVAESFLAVYGFPGRAGKLDEETALCPIESKHPFSETVMALRSLEQQHQDARRQGAVECVILRFGLLYGPGVVSTERMLRNLSRGRLWIPEPVTGTASWLHIEDAVSALAAALDEELPGGIYNICDDQPAGLGQAVEVAREILAAHPPRSFPAWLLSWLAPMIASMAAAHWAMDNRKARRVLGWQPTFPTLHEGFASLMGTMAGPSGGVRRV